MVEGLQRGAGLSKMQGAMLTAEKGGGGFGVGWGAQSGLWHLSQLMRPGSACCCAPTLACT